MLHRTTASSWYWFNVLQLVKFQFCYFCIPKLITRYWWLRVSQQLPFDHLHNHNLEVYYGPNIEISFTRQNCFNSVKLSVSTDVTTDQKTYTLSGNMKYFILCDFLNQIVTLMQTKYVDGKLWQMVSNSSALSTESPLWEFVCYMVLPVCHG